MVWRRNLENAVTLGNRRNPKVILEQFHDSLIHAPGGQIVALRYWREMLEASGIDRTAAAIYYSAWKTDNLNTFGRVGAICLATDALNNGDMLRFAAVCLHGIELENR